MIIKFGDWEIHKEYGLIGKVGYDYAIAPADLWETRIMEGRILWALPIHLAEKTWMSLDNVNDFNTAFFFAQDYFQQFRPVSPAGSTAQTLFVQRQLLELSDRDEEYPSKDGILILDEAMKDRVWDYMQKRSNIKYLN